MVPPTAELLTLARNDAAAQVTLKAQELARSVKELDAAVPSGEFRELALEAQDSAACFSLYSPSIRLLNVSSMLHRVALVSGLHRFVDPQLRAVSRAQDLLDEACYVQRQYIKSSCQSTVLAASVRTGHWRNLASLARSVQLDAVLRIDTTVAPRFANEVGCQPQLVLALGRLSVLDAVTAAFCVNYPPVQHTATSVCASRA